MTLSVTQDRVGTGGQAFAVLEDLVTRGEPGPNLPASSPCDSLSLLQAPPDETTTAMTSFIRRLPCSGDCAKCFIVMVPFRFDTSPWSQCWVSAGLQIHMKRRPPPHTHTHAHTPCKVGGTDSCPLMGHVAAYHTVQGRWGLAGSQSSGFAGPQPFAA